MELRLVRKAQARAGVERDRRAANLRDVVQAGAVDRLQLAIEKRLIVPGGAEEIAVEADEVACDSLARDDAFDAIDRRRVTLGGQPRAALAVIPLEFEEAIVERIDEVGRRRARLSAANAAVFDHHHRLPNLGKQIGSREPGDTSANDADIGSSHRQSVAHMSEP